MGIKLHNPTIHYLTISTFVSPRLCFTLSAFAFPAASVFLSVRHVCISVSCVFPLPVWPLCMFVCLYLWFCGSLHVAFCICSSSRWAYPSTWAQLSERRAQSARRRNSNQRPWNLHWCPLQTQPHLRTFTQLINIGCNTLQASGEATGTSTTTELHTSSSISSREGGWKWTPPREDPLPHRCSFRAHRRDLPDSCAAISWLPGPP